MTRTRYPIRPPNGSSVPRVQARLTDFDAQRRTAEALRQSAWDLVEQMGTANERLAVQLAKRGCTIRAICERTGVGVAMARLFRDGIQ